MVDIHSLTAEIRRGKKRRKKKQDENIMVCPLHRATIKSSLMMGGLYNNVWQAVEGSWQLGDGEMDDVIWR